MNDDSRVTISLSFVQPTAHSHMQLYFPRQTRPTLLTTDSRDMIVTPSLSFSSVIPYHKHFTQFGTKRTLWWRKANVFHCTPKRCLNIHTHCGSFKAVIRRLVMMNHKFLLKFNKMEAFIRCQRKKTTFLTKGILYTSSLSSFCHLPLLLCISVHIKAADNDLFLSCHCGSLSSPTLNQCPQHVTWPNTLSVASQCVLIYLSPSEENDKT